MSALLNARLSDLDAERISAAPVPEFAALEPTTVIAHDFGRVLNDIRSADLEEAQMRRMTIQSARNLIASAGLSQKLDIREVLAFVGDLLEYCDGDSSVIVQDCAEALEEEAQGCEAVLRKIDAVEAAYPVDFSGEKRA